MWRAASATNSSLRLKMKESLARLAHRRAAGPGRRTPCRCRFLCWRSEREFAARLKPPLPSLLSRGSRLPSNAGSQAERSCSLWGPSHAAAPAASPLARRQTITPVRLPPGRLRLVTRPSLTGSLPADEHDWNRRRYSLGRECRDGAAGRNDNDNLTANQIGRQRR